MENKDIKEKVNEAPETEVKEEGRYKELTRLDDNLWSYGSPVIFESGILERDTVSMKNRLTLKFTNIYEQTIRDLYLVILAEDDEGNIEEIEHSYVALGQGYLTSKGTAAKIQVKNENARKFEIKVEQVVFQDGSVWSKEDSVYEGMGEIEDIEVFAAAKIKDYEDSYISGIEEIEKDDSVSIGNGIEILKRVSWYKDSDEILKNAKRKYKIVKQNEERKQESQKRREQRQKAVKKRYITAGIVLVVIALLVAVSIFAFFIPNGKYKDAKKLLKDKKYDKAVEAFEGLDGFLSSEKYLADAYYNIGLKYLNKGDEKKAEEYFRKSRQSDAKADSGIKAGAYVDYYDGLKALENKEYDKAMKLFESCIDASVYNLVNKASAGMAQISFGKGEYEKAWNTIKNVYAKDNTYQAQYGEYGYQYAKTLIDGGNIKNGMEVYNSVADITQDFASLAESVYNQAVKLAEGGDIDGALELLKQAKDSYKKAKKLYDDMSEFHDKAQYWVGTWTHKGKVNGEKKVYEIKILEVLYEGEMCLRIVDQNNKTLGFDTVLSKKERVTQIVIGMYQLHFKLKKYHDQKFTYNLLEGNKMERVLKYNGETYKTKYKKKTK